MAPPAQDPLKNKSYQGIPLGFWVRRQVGRGTAPIPPPGADIKIFRVRRGNGYYGSVAGKRYQERYTYFVPSSINNPEGQAARDALTQAVYNWKNILTEEQKKTYNKRATKGLHMSGFNLYLREYIKANT